MKSKNLEREGVFPRIQKIVDFNASDIEAILPEQSTLRLFVTQESDHVFLATIKIRMWKKEIVIKETAADPSEAFFLAKRRAKRQVESLRNKKKRTGRRKSRRQMVMESHQPLETEEHWYEEAS